jgi:hypothetical protein
VFRLRIFSVKMTKKFSKIFEHFIFQKKFFSENSKFFMWVRSLHKKTKKLSWLCSKTKLELKLRVFETHFLTTRWPKNFFLLGIVFFGGDYAPIANKCLSTVLSCSSTVLTAFNKKLHPNNAFSVWWEISRTHRNSWN